MDEARRSLGYGSSESWGLVMVGGYNPNSGVLTSVETTNNGEYFGSLPDLEIETTDSCVVVIDEDKIFTCGAAQGSGRDTFIFSKSTNLWSRYTKLGRRPSQKYLIIFFQHD